MSWNLDSDRPIYMQIIERLKMDIISGVYAPGQKLPSVREFAMEASVNPNTMQRALAELERDGLVFSQRTSGRFITEDVSLMKEIKVELASEQIKEFLKRMERLGIQKEEIIALINTISEGEK